MAQENYIHIYTSFLSDLYQSEQITFQETLNLLKEFQPVCDDLRNRQDLLKFLGTQTGRFPAILPLQNQLLDENYKFPEPPTGAGLTH